MILRNNYSLIVHCLTSLVLRLWRNLSELLNKRIERRIYATVIIPLVHFFMRSI